MRESAQYSNDEVPIPAFYVLEIHQDTFRQEKPIVEIHTAETLSPISVSDYLYEVSFPDPLAVPCGHILQVAAKQHVISTHSRDQVMHITKVCGDLKAAPFVTTFGFCLNRNLLELDCRWPVHALKQRLLVVDTDSCEVLINCFLDLVVRRHFMILAAFLMKP